MGIGIQIKKPESLTAVPEVHSFQAPAPNAFPPLYYLMLLLTFPAAFVALYFFFQSRTV